MAITEADKQGFLPKKREPDTRGLATKGKINTDLEPYDLSQINMVQLAKDFAAKINKPEPRTWIGKIFYNHKLRHDVARIDLLVSIVDRFRVLNTKAHELHAELFLAPQVLEAIIRGKLEEAKRVAERQIAEHKHYLDSLYEDTRKKRVENDKTEAEARRLNALSGLVEKVTENINPNSVPRGLKDYAVAKAVNPDMSGFIDFDLLETAKEAGKIELMAKARSADLQNEDMAAKVRVTKKTSQMNEAKIDREMDKSRNKP